MKWICLIALASLACLISGIAGFSSVVENRRGEQTRQVHVSAALLASSCNGRGERVVLVVSHQVVRASSNNNGDRVVVGRTGITLPVGTGAQSLLMLY